MAQVTRSAWSAVTGIVLWESAKDQLQTRKGRILRFSRKTPMSFKPPADMVNGLCYETPSDGEVRVHIVRDGKAVDYFDCTESDLGFSRRNPC